MFPYIVLENKSKVIKRHTGGKVNGTLGCWMEVLKIQFIWDKHQVKRRSQGLTCALSKVLPNQKVKRENSANKKKSKLTVENKAHNCSLSCIGKFTT